MLQRTHPDTNPHEDALLRPGGFAWWYVDLVDEKGDGLVLIWAWGLPFLPGLARDAREGRPTLPRARPALSFALYEGGVCTCYLLQEFDEDDVQSDLRSRFQIGGATLEIHRRAKDKWPENIDIHAIFDLAIPGSEGRVRGELHATGPVLTGGPLGPQYAAHVWSPQLVGAPGTATLDIDGRRRTLTGRVYQDRNESTVPLHDHGIHHWWWGRLSLADRTLLWYRLHHRDGHVEEHLLDVALDGCARPCAAPATLARPTRWTFFGPRCPRYLELVDGDGQPHQVALDAPIDDSPFYQRLRMRSDQGGFGWAERVIPDAIDPDWMRPLVRMRVHHTTGANSFWLPLFAGPMQTRIRRLLRLPTPTRALP